MLSLAFSYNPMGSGKQSGVLLPTFWLIKSLKLLWSALSHLYSFSSFSWVIFWVQLRVQHLLNDFYVGNKFPPNYLLILIHVLCIMIMMMKNLPRNFFICTTRYIYWIHCFFLHKYGHIMRLPRLPSGKESACQYSRHRRCRFDPWVRRIPGSRSWHPTPVFLPGEFHGQRSLAGYSPLCTSFANFFFFF